MPPETLEFEEPIAALLKETELSEIEVEQGDFRIRISRHAAAAPTQVTYTEAPRPAEAPPAAGSVEPPKSLAEMEALAHLPEVKSVRLPRGKLSVYEEFPDATFEAIAPFLNETR